MKVNIRVTLVVVTVTVLCLTPTICLVLSGVTTRPSESVFRALRRTSTAYAPSIAQQTNRAPANAFAGLPTKHNGDLSHRLA